MNGVSYRKLVVVALVLLPSFLFAWHMNAPLFAQLTAWTLNHILPGLFPDYVLGLRAADDIVLVSCRVPSEQALPMMEDRSFALKLQLYSFSLPLFAALAVASEASALQHTLRLAGGIGAILIYIVASGAIRVMHILYFGLFFPRVEILPTSEFTTQLIHFGHYLTYTVLPMALPVILWALLYQDNFKAIIRLRTAADERTPDASPPAAGEERP